MEQRSDDWFQIRLGKVTASRIADLTAKTRTGWGASRANYMAQLIAERLTGTVAESYTNGAMQWGIDTEDSAREAYEFVTDVEVAQVGFADHPHIEMSGASPDGLIGTEGLVEIKCPNTATHIDTLLSGKIPAKYIKQMQWQMACTNRQWCDFVSYDPRMPSHMSIFIKRLKRDEDQITELETAVTDFLSELDDKLSQLKSRYED